jgi:predicted dinucleotide-binding enzyme
MTIGTIGAGGIGRAFVGHVAKGGYEVSVSNSRGPESLTGVVDTLGPRGQSRHAPGGAQADVVVVSVRWA